MGDEVGLFEASQTLRAMRSFKPDPVPHDVLRRILEAETKSVLGLSGHVETAVLVPLGYPTGRFGPTERRPVEEVAFSDRWGQLYA